MIQKWISDLFVLSNINNIFIFNRFLLILLFPTLTIIDKDLLKSKTNLYIPINNCFEDLIFINTLDNVITNSLEPCYNDTSFDSVLESNYILIAIICINILFILDIFSSLSLLFFLNNFSFYFCFLIIVCDLKDIFDSNK